jgi:hypothetical protein
MAEWQPIDRAPLEVALEGIRPAKDEQLQRTHSH